MVRLFSAGFLLLRFLMAICHTSSAEHAPCPTTVEKHRRFSKAWARLQSLDGPGWHSALQQHVLPLYEKRPDYEKTSTAVQAWVAGSGIAPDRAGVALPPGLPCKLRLAALLNSVFWVLEKEWKCGKFAGYNVAPMWTDFESVYSALMHALLLLNHRQVAAADVRRQQRARRTASRCLNTCVGGAEPSPAGVAWPLLLPTRFPAHTACLCWPAPVLAGCAQ